MDPDVTRDLLQAVQVQYNPLVSPEDKEAAMKYCDSFTNECQTSAQYGMNFADHRTGYGDEIRLFGLRLVEHVVKFRWPETPPADREWLKEQMLMGVCSFVRPILEERTFIKQKLSVIIAEIAKREWPQRWPALLDSLLLQAAMAGPVQREIALVTLRILTEEMLDLAQPLPIDRRQELRAGLNECLPMILSFLTDTLMTSVPAYRESLAKEHELLISACLETLSVFVGWIDFEHIFQANYLTMFCALLESVPHRLIACDCLYSILERKDAKEDRGPLLTTFANIQALTAPMPPLTNTYRDVEDSNYTFTARLCETLVVIGTNQLCTLWGVHGIQREAPPNFDNYLQAVFECSQHPSLRICGVTLPLWLQLLKHDTARTNPLVLDFGRRLQELALERLARPGDPDRGFMAGPSAMFCEVDFSSLEEFETVFSLFRNNWISIVRIYSGIDPDYCISAAASAYGAALAMRGAMGPLKPNTQLYSRWDATKCFVESVLHGVLALPEGARSPNVNQVVGQCLEATLSIQTEDPTLLLIQLALLDTLLPALKAAAAGPETLLQVLQLLFTLMEFRAVEDHGQMVANAAGDAAQFHTGLSEGAKVRRKAGSVLVNLCESPPETLLSLLGQVISSVQEIIPQPHVTEMQKRLLIEALLAAGNQLPSFDEHVSFINGLLESMAEFPLWLSEDAAGIFSDPAQFCDFGGLSSISTFDPFPQRSRLTNLMMVVALALRTTRTHVPGAVGGAQAAAADAELTAKLSGAGGCAAGGDGLLHPCRDALVSILNNVLRLVRCLHFLWAPECALIPPPLTQILDIRRVDLAQLLGAVGLSRSAQMTKDEWWVDRTQLWLSSLRESAYCVFSYACKQGVIYEMPNVEEALQLTVFSYLPHMHKRHLRAVVKHVLNPLLQYAPRTAAGLQAIAPSLTFLYTYLLEFLTNEWMKSEARRSSDASVSAALLDSGSAIGEAAALPPDLREIAHDCLMSELTEDVLSHVLHVLADINTPAGGVGVAAGQNGGAHLAGSSGGAAAAAAAASASAAASAAAKAGAAAKLPHTFGFIGEFVLLHEQLGVLSLKILSATLTGPSASACSRAADLLSSIVPVIATNLPQYQEFAAVELLRVALGALSRHGQHNECETNLLKLVW